MANAFLVQNFNLPGEIHSNFSVDWSTDNKIAVCTAKTIFILTSHCSPVESGFPSPLHKKVILVPKETFTLREIFIPPNAFKFVKSQKDKDNLYSVLMDNTLVPKPPERAEMLRCFRCCKWSPKGAAKGGRCLIAALTMDHRLVLYEEINKEWISICDLTEIFKEECKEKKSGASNSKNVENKPSKRPKRAAKVKRKHDDSSDEEFKPKPKSISLSSFDISRNLNYEKLVAEIYKIAPVDMIWTGMFGTPSSSLTDSYEYCFLIVAMKSGHIQFWRVSPNDGGIVTIAHEWDTGMETLTTICWQQTSPTGGFIMCGSTKGVLSFLPVNVRFDDKQKPKVSLKQMCKIWDEEDNIPVDHISVLKIALKKYVIIAAKLHVLVGCEIVQSDSSIVIKNVGHSYGLHCLPVTGMAVLDTAMPQYRVLIATMEGLIIEIKVSLGDDEIKFQHEKISVDLDFKNNKIKGLAVSPNGLMAAMVLNTAVYFDHLLKKEPLQFVLFVTKPFEDIYAKLKKLLKPQFSFLPSSNCSISRQIDFLEIIRINMSCGTPLPDWLTAFIDNDPATYENCSSFELYFMRFILHAFISGLAVSVSQDKDTLESKLFTVESLIMKKYISKVFESCQDKIDLLTPAQGQSLLLMADWLYKEFQMPLESLYLALGSDVPTDVESLPPREACCICKGDVKLENMKSGHCAKNHMFARCCQSLLLCDVITYHQCPSCKSIALPDVWSFGLVCTYCGVSML